MKQQSATWAEGASMATDNAAGSSDAYLDLELVAEVPQPKK